jgi:hydroxypyruvate isomerase
MKEYGLTSAMGWDTYPEGVTLDDFACNPTNHDGLLKYYTDLIPTAANAGVHNLIALSGQRQGRSSADNLEHTAKLMAKVLPIAADHDITISIEYLNSKVDHPDHQFDHMQWGVNLCDRLNSDHFKILYDIYHAQIMEGNVVATIRQYSDYISHYHTAGVPGRHHIDDTQELNYSFVMEAIRDTGYRGYIGQEFIPTGESNEDKIGQLRQAVEICSV